MSSVALDRALQWSVRFSLSVIHASLWLKNACNVLLGYLIAACSYPWKKLAQKEDNLIEVIRADAKGLEKLPIHLAVAVLEDCELDQESLAHLTVWCFAAGIHNVSLYDPQGVCGVGACRCVCACMCVCVYHLFATAPTRLKYRSH